MWDAPTAVIILCRPTDTATEGLVIRQQIRQRAQAARDARRVALTRGYRKGELPDIEQLTVSDFAEPLRATDRHKDVHVASEGVSGRLRVRQMRAP